MKLKVNFESYVGMRSKATSQLALPVRRYILPLLAHLGQAFRSGEAHAHTASEVLRRCGAVDSQSTFGNSFPDPAVSFRIHPWRSSFPAFTVPFPAEQRHPRRTSFEPVPLAMRAQFSHRITSFRNSLSTQGGVPSVTAIKCVPAIAGRSATDQHIEASNSSSSRDTPVDIAMVSNR